MSAAGRGGAVWGGDERSRNEENRIVPERGGAGKGREERRRQAGRGGETKQAGRGEEFPGREKPGFHPSNFFLHSPLV